LSVNYHVVTGVDQPVEPPWGEALAGDGQVRNESE
jgi:hypothetical protein